MKGARISLLALGAVVAALVFAGFALAQTEPDEDAEAWMGMGPGMMMGQGMMGGMGPGMMGGKGQGMMGHRFMMMERLRALNLTADQRNRIRTIHMNTQKQVIPKQADLHVKTVELQELMLAEQPNENQIQTKVNEMSTVRGQIEMLGIRNMLQARGVLTPEQREKFLDPEWRPPMGPQGPGPGPVHRGGMMER